MATTGTGGTLPPNFLLTPQQQSLLFAALNSNKPQASGSPTANALSLSPNSFEASPMQPKASNSAGYQESPYLDNYDYDFGDSSFDFSFAAEDQPSMIGDLPGTVTSKSESTDNDGNDGNEKRSHPDDEDDEASPGNDPKRRESTEKAPKKPGRKPLTSEPTSKRKAQNRAAQRAFRERKEKHLKDLETKVEELEKASEAANHENSLLRSQVERMTTELNQYKQRLSAVANTKAIPRDKMPFGNAAVNNLSDVNFQFEFPKFGMLPGPAVNKSQGESHPTSPQQGISPSNKNGASSSMDATASQNLFKEDLARFAGIFSPSMASSATHGSRASVDSGNFSVGPATSSPSASSNSNAGPSSSCGTSPEPYTQSPLGFKPLETLTTIGEEHSSHSSLPTSGQPFSEFANVDLNNTNFDWLTQQNGGHFDPQLFGDYREPQENILSNSQFDDLLNDSLDADFFTPYNMGPTSNLATKMPAHKPNLIDEIDAQQNAMDDEPFKKQPMNCNQLWEKLQSCPKAQNGEFDLDGLCSELTKKAKCSGTGPVVGETDFDTILKKYMGKDVSSSCVADTLGIEINSDDKVKSMPSAST